MKVNKKRMLGSSLMVLLSGAFIYVACNETKFRGKNSVVKCSPLGDVRSTTCQDNRNAALWEVCGKEGWRLAWDQCNGAQPSPSPGPGDCDKTTFQDVRQLIRTDCVSCHAGWDSYRTFVTRKDESLRRLRLPTGDRQHMPPGRDLAENDILLVQNWINDGAKERCENGGGNGGNNPFVDLDDIEVSILNDLNSEESEVRPFLRYLIATHRNNTNQLSGFKEGTEKAINSLSQRGRLVRLDTVDLVRSVFRVDLRDFGLNRQDWVDIERFDRINLESFTNNGLLIKFLTQTRKPWMHVDNFAFTAHGNAVLYYSLLRLPNNAAQLFRDIGVDFNNDFDDRSARLIGFNGSPISLNKNRLLSRHDSDDGFLWITYDTVDDFAADRNLFEFPLVVVGEAQFGFDAAEMIFTLPNGLLGYYLSDNRGNRQNEAPLNIVQDNVTPFDVEIKNALSCHRCHTKLIEANDQIKAHVLANASDFALDDVELVEDLYEENERGLFDADNSQYHAALQGLGIRGSDIDQVNMMTDLLRDDMDAAEVAAYVFLRESEFLALLERSEQARQQVGQLLTGGTITFEQFLQTLPVILEDLNIARDD